MAQFAAEDVDLVVLDIMLPKLDGLEVCKRLRAESEVPIIMLTARDDELDKVLGLELGADDYITKPFSIREFRSRVRALLRRAAAPRRPEEDGDVISVGGPDDRSRAADSRGASGADPAHLRRVRAAAHPRCESGPGVQQADAARGALGRRRLPRAADDRRARPSSAREARARPRRPGVHPHGARCRVPLPRPVNPLRSVGARLGLALAVVVAAALILVDLIVVPSLERNLIDAKLRQLSEAAPGIGSQLLNSETFNLDDTIHVRLRQRGRPCRLLRADHLPPAALARPCRLERGHLRRHRKRPARAASLRRGSRGQRDDHRARDPLCGGGIPSLRRPGRPASGLAAGLAAEHQPGTPPPGRRRVSSPSRHRCSSAISWLRSSPAGSGGSSGQPIGSRAVTSVSPSSIQGGTSLPNWLPPSSGCAQRLAQLEHAQAGVHRQRVARAAHTALLTRRLPRADGRRGPGSE